MENVTSGATNSSGPSSAPAIPAAPTDKSATYAIVGGIVGFVAIVGAIVFVWLARRRRRPHNANFVARRNSNDIMPPPAIATSVRPHYDSVSAATSARTEGEIYDSGNMYSALPASAQRPQPSAYF